MKNIKYWFLLLAGLFLFVESACAAGLYLLKKCRGIEYQPILKDSLHPKHREILSQLVKNETSYFTHHPELGWDIKPNGRHGFYEANSQGIRGSQDYPLQPLPGTLRIAAFGDSFTHCDNVPNEATWQEHLEKLSPSLEVMNFGVGGYGLAQSFLRYRLQGTKYRPHIVLIGFLPENIYRNVSVFRPFYQTDTNLPLAKPTFELKHPENSLELKPNPMPDISDYAELLESPETRLPRLGKHDYHYRTRYGKGFFDFLPSVRIIKIIARQLKDSTLRFGRYNPESEAFRKTAKIFDAFYKSSIENRSKPVIVIHVSKEDVERYRKNRQKIYEPLLAYFQEKNYDYIDLMDAFEKYGRQHAVGSLFISHYSNLANELVSRHMMECLTEKGHFAKLSGPIE